MPPEILPDTPEAIAAAEAAKTAADTEAAKVAAQKVIDDKASKDAAEAAAAALALVPEVTPTVATPEVWEPSGDAFVDTIAKGFLAKGGTVASFDALLQDVADKGEMTAAAKVELKKTFGDMADALIPVIEDKAKANLEWVAKERTAIYNAAGGEAAFAEMQKWAAANLDAATRGFITAAIQLGGESARMGVAHLRQHMVSKGATVVGEIIKSEGEGGADGTLLTLTEYIVKNRELNRLGDTAGIAELAARARTAQAAATAKGQKWR